MLSIWNAVVNCMVNIVSPCPYRNSGLIGKTPVKQKEETSSRIQNYKLYINSTIKWTSGVLR